MSNEIENFIAGLEQSLADATFVKLTLGNYKGPEPQLQRLSVRLVVLKKGTRLMFQYRYITRDVIKNFEFNEGIGIVQKDLAAGFRSAHLCTTAKDIQLTIGKRNARMIVGKPTFKQSTPASHNREKKWLIDPSAYYLKALGIATDKSEIKASQQDKWRQINKFVEILAGLVENSPLKDKPNLRIVDMGSGKGYLTFAAYDYFVRNGSGSDGVLGRSPPHERGAADASFDGVLGGDQPPKGPPPYEGWVAAASADGVVLSQTRIQMTGVEQRPELVDLCNEVAKAGGFDGLNFVRGTIADFDPGEVDILIALHACDTATDDALFKGITAKAEIIVAAPCCHKEIRPQITPPAMFSGILKHGIMLERTAETITDGLRSLLLERSGYTTKLFEFVATEHTPKNNMLVATQNAKRSNTEKIDRQIREIKNLYGIGNQRLEELLRS